MQNLQNAISLLEESFSHALVTEEGSLAERTEKYHVLCAKLQEVEDRWLDLAQKA
jgi:ATP-binding cassette subfamily F protein uup